MKCPKCQDILAYVRINDKRSGKPIRAQWNCGCGATADAPLLTDEELEEYLLLKFAKV